MDYWACNPEVLRLLNEAKRRMEDGYVSEAKMEAVLLAHLQVSQYVHRVVSAPVWLPVFYPESENDMRSLNADQVGKLKDVDTSLDVHCGVTHLLDAFVRTECMASNFCTNPIQAEARPGSKFPQADEKITLHMEDLVSALNEHVRLCTC